MKGTSHDQQIKFKDKTQKMIATTKFPKIFSEKVDMDKVNLDVMRIWCRKFTRIADKITEILGFEDDVCIGLIMNLLEDKEDPKRIFVELTGFFEAETFKFMKQLWAMLLSAQESVGGIPKSILDKAKEEIRKDRLSNEKKIEPNPQERNPREARRSRSISRLRLFTRSPRNPSPYHIESFHNKRRSPLDLERSRHKELSPVRRSASRSPPRSRGYHRRYSRSPPSGRNPSEQRRYRDYDSTHPSQHYESSRRYGTDYGGRNRSPIPDIYHHRHDDYRRTRSWRDDSRNYTRSRDEQREIRHSRDGHAED